MASCGDVPVAASATILTTMKSAMQAADDVPNLPANPFGSMFLQLNLNGVFFGSAVHTGLLS